MPFFPPQLSHLMVLFKPILSKSYRSQWEFYLTSNCSFDPRIQCMTEHFYCFCINTEKWPPPLLNHMKHLNLSSPPEYSAGTKSHSAMTAWNYSSKQLCRFALLLLTLEYFYHLNFCFTTAASKSVLILLEEMKYNMCIASNHLNTSLFFSNCWVLLYFCSIMQLSFAVAAV